MEVKNPKLGELSYDKLKEFRNPVTDLVYAYGKYTSMKQTMQKCPSITREDLALKAARILLNPHLLGDPSEFQFVMEDIRKTCAGQHLEEILKIRVTTTVPLKAVLKNYY